MALTITRKEFTDAIERIEKISSETPYLDQFEITFPDGLNTASALEICRIAQDSSFDAKVRLLRICIAGKNVRVKCPNGEEKAFKLGDIADSFDGLDLFREEPLALAALADTVYGYVLKKSLRSSQAQAKPIATA